jgi:hypothetical protein
MKMYINTVWTELRPVASSFAGQLPKVPTYNITGINKKYGVEQIFEE